jgi:hypothetical protein
MQTYIPLYGQPYRKRLKISLWILVVFLLLVLTGTGVLVWKYAAELLSDWAFLKTTCWTTQVYPMSWNRVYAVWSYPTITKELTVEMYMFMETLTLAPPTNKTCFYKATDPQYVREYQNTPWLSEGLVWIKVLGCVCLVLIIASIILTCLVNRKKKRPGFRDLPVENDENPSDDVSVD